MIIILFFKHMCCPWTTKPLISLRVKKEEEKIAFKSVQIKFLATHVTINFVYIYIFTVGNVLNILEYDIYLVSYDF